MRRFYSYLFGYQNYQQKILNFNLKEESKEVQKKIPFKKTVEKWNSQNKSVGQLFLEYNMKVSHLNNFKYPNFITKLKYARQVLYTLRQQKIKDKKQDKSIFSNQVIKVECEDIKKEKSIQKSYKDKIEQEEKEEIKVVKKKSQKEILEDSLNKIGVNLYETYKDIEQYESIFTNLTAYYTKNSQIIEQSEKLKKKSFQLNELIQAQQGKISKNYEKIKTIQQDNEKVEQAIKETLKNVLTQNLEHQKMDLKIRVTKQDNKKQNFNDFQQKNGESQQLKQIKLNLKFKELIKGIPKIKKATQVKAKIQSLEDTSLGALCYKELNEV